MGLHETLVGYIAGPSLTADEGAFNFEAFDDEALRLRSRGYVVISPVDLCRAHGIDADGPTSQLSPEATAMFARTDIQALMQADFVVALPGWARSRAARCEVAVARSIGLQVFDPDMNPVDLGVLDERLPE